jgi:glycosyltransferase involved in cell wall biosynthesis
VRTVRVLHLCDKFGVAGSSIHGVTRLFSWWFPRHAPRFEVALAGLKHSEPASRLLEAQGIPVVHLGRSKFDLRAVGDVARLLRERRVDVLHVHGYAASDFGRLAARSAGARLVLHEHFADPRLPAYQALADRLLAGRTDAAIAVSESTREFLVRERRVPRERVRLIWNGAPLEEFAPVPRELALARRRELGLPEQALVIGAIGRLNEQKGHRYLLDAARSVFARRDAWLLVVGDGDLAGALRRQADELAIAPRVVFAGHRSDVPELLGAIDVLAISSNYEGTPLTLFEALAAGKPVVSTAVDGCREVIRDGENGLLVAPRDSSGLAEALLRVLDDAALRARLAAAARADSARYDVRECVRRMEELYDELLAA